ncbi:MAG: sigma factor-like helix-turn-helix DNA-binding protein [Pyrinomonadaceae bacterium]
MLHTNVLDLRPTILPNGVIYEVEAATPPEPETQKILKRLEEQTYSELMKTRDEASKLIKMRVVLCERNLFRFFRKLFGEKAKLKPGIDIEIIFNYVDASLVMLTNQQRHIIVNHFGLETWCRQTQEKVGENLGLSQSKVSRIEAEAIKKLKRRSSSLERFLQT